MTENNIVNDENENTGDELEFYDFIEIIADKIDSIAQQSIEESIIIFSLILRIWFSF